MIVLSCTSCQKKLSVKDELAGRKVSCPGCGKVVLVPALAKSPIPLAPTVASESQDLPAGEPLPRTRAEDQVTQPPPSVSDVTKAPGFGEPEHDSSLTDFLAPPQADDELGRLITSLDLSGTQVSDAGLVHLKDCTDLRHLYLGATQVSDAGLANFKGFKNFTALKLHDTTVTDTGLAHFKDSKNLTWLFLNRTPTTDAGLAHFKDCKNLTILDLSSTKVSDAGLAHARDWQIVDTILLSGTRVTDVGLSYFAGCAKLRQVNVKKTTVTEAGVKKFAVALPQSRIEWDGGVIEPKDAAGWVSLFNGKDLTGWKDTAAHGAFWKVEDGVLRYVGKGGKNLATEKNYKDFELYVDWKVEPGCDSGLYLRGQPQVQIWEEKHPPSLGPGGKFIGSGGLYNNPAKLGQNPLVVADLPAGQWNTFHVRMVCDKVTVKLNDKLVVDNVPMLPGQLPAEGPVELQVHNGQIWFRNLRIRELKEKSDPKASANQASDRRAGEWVLSIGGAVSIKENGKERRIGAIGDLPGAAFELTAVDLNNNPKVSDAGLAHFKDCKNLTFLGLGGTQVSDAGLAHVKDCKSLSILDLQVTKVSDAGLAHFKDCKDLERLGLGETRIGDAGLGHFRDCKNLLELYLSGTQLSDAGLAKNLAALKQLKRLSLAGSGLTDAGIKHLAGRTNLEWLDLRRTKASAAGVAELQRALPRCKIDWDRKKE